MSPFADIEAKNTGSFQKIKFLDTPPGQHLIRILDEKATRVHTHYVNGSTVLCLEDECPICLSNRKIYLEHPDDFRDVKGYSPKTKRYFANVLDRTMVKVCSNSECGIENKKLVNDSFPPTCSGCGTVITDVTPTPSNKVKLFSFGVQVAEALNAASQAIIGLDGEPVALTSYDFALVVKGLKKEKKTDVVAIANRNDKVEVPAESLFDANKASIALTAEEMVQLQKGVSLRDLFAARKADKSEAKIEQMAEESAEDIKNAIDKLFPN